MAEKINSIEELVTTENKNITPQQYFNAVKDRKHHIDDDQLKQVYDNCLELLEKYKITGQTHAMRKILFHLSCIEKEREIVKMGINTFIYRDDIEYYINNISFDVVKIIELENYDREIPDEIVQIISKVKNKFDQLYIVFTDYTGEKEREVEEERREKDPILFGTFQDRSTRTVIDRFYYLGDWVDEYCNLTLDKMINDTKNLGHRDIQHTIKTSEDLQELRNQLGNIVSSNNGLTVNATSYRVLSDSEAAAKKHSFFDKIKSFLTKS